MLALVLVGALVAQAFGAPTNCAEFCDDQAVGSGYNSQSRSSYSGYAKSSSYNSGSRSANLETLDENAIGANGFNANVDRPGNWRDEKHYVTDDGHGQMSYRAGQTVTGNGYSKFAEHSYSYGTHESHPAQANSQILSTAEFNAELQNLRGRINSFMGSFHVSAGSLVNAETLEDFKNKASVINNQLTNVCNQVDSGSSMYEQMHRMQQDFIRNVERMQRQMESIIIQSSSSSSVSAVVQPYPTAPSYIQPAPTNPAPIQQIPEYVSPTPDTIVQEINENFHHVNEEITTFYKTYTGSLDIQQRANIIAQASDIIKKLTDLEAQSVVKEDLCSSITYQKTSFQTFYQNILDHLQSLDNRALLDEKEKINSQLQEESAKFADNKRLLEKQKADIERQIEIKNQQHNELIAKLREQAEAAKRQQEVLKKQQEELRIRQEQIRREEQQRVEELRRRSEEERLAKQEVERVQPVQTAGSVHVSGSSNFESTIKASSSYDSSIHGSSGASYVRPTQSQPIYNAPAHLDFIALTNKLQQDLYRVQNEISNFNTYKMRLTAANSESVKAEALRRADFLRQRITNLCETSDQYRNQEIHSSAEALKRRFEEMVRSFESQAANYASQSGFSASGGYSSHSSYGTSGSVASVQAPSITNIEYEHSKSTELELSRRPVSSQRYAQGSESGYNGQQVDCVEAYASQPCVEQQQLRRYRRQAGGN